MKRRPPQSALTRSTATHRAVDCTTTASFAVKRRPPQSALTRSADSGSDRMEHGDQFDPGATLSKAGGSFAGAVLPVRGPIWLHKTGTSCFTRLPWRRRYLIDMAVQEGLYQNRLMHVFSSRSRWLWFDGWRPARQWRGLERRRRRTGDSEDLERRARAHNRATVGRPRFFSPSKG